MPPGVLWGVSRHLDTHTHDTSVRFTKRKKEIRSAQTMTNFICQYARPIFCQFNILLLDRPTLTTHFHWSEKDTRFLLFLQTQFSMGTISSFSFPFLYPRSTSSVETKCSVSRYINVYRSEKTPEGKSLFFNQKLFCINKNYVHNFLLDWCIMLLSN